MAVHAKKAITVRAGVAVAVALCTVLFIGAEACGGGSAGTTTSTAATVASTTSTTLPPGPGVIDPALVGSWHSSSIGSTYVFTADWKFGAFQDGTKLGTPNATYRFDDAGVMSISANGEWPTWNYVINADTLTITFESGKSATFDRVN